jgi:hypothetical protein
MNTIAEFCELFCHLDSKQLLLMGHADEPQRLAGRMDHGQDKDDVPLLVALQSDGETSDSSDTEDGSFSSLHEPEDLECGMVTVVAPRPAKPSRRVSFDTVVAVREHAVTVGVGSTMMDADELPLQLDWHHADTTFRSIHASKHRDRGCDDRGPPRLSLPMRRERLKRVSRYTDQELDRIVTGAKAFSLLSYFNF